MDWAVMHMGDRFERQGIDESDYLHRPCRVTCCPRFAVERDGKNKKGW